MLRIDISSLKAGVHNFVLEPEAEAVDLDPAMFRDIRVEARLDVYERRILVMLETSATARLECDRTLKPFDQHVEGRFSLLFAPPDPTAAEEEAYDDVQVLQPFDQSLDVTTAVRDTLMLALPTRRVAPGAEDLDIDTVFGQPDEEHIDPRWEALRRLRSPDEE